MKHEERRLKKKFQYKRNNYGARDTATVKEWSK